MGEVWTSQRLSRGRIHVSPGGAEHVAHEGAHRSCVPSLGAAGECWAWAQCAVPASLLPAPFPPQAICQFAAWAETETPSKQKGLSNALFTYFQFLLVLSTSASQACALPVTRAGWMLGYVHSPVSPALSLPSLQSYFLFQWVPCSKLLCVSVTIPSRRIQVVLRALECTRSCCSLSAAVVVTWFPVCLLSLQPSQPRRAMARCWWSSMCPATSVQLPGRSSARAARGRRTRSTSTWRIASWLPSSWTTSHVLTTLTSLCHSKSWSQSFSWLIFLPGNVWRPLVEFQWICLIWLGTFPESPLLEGCADHRKQIHLLSIRALAVHPELHPWCSAACLVNICVLTESSHQGSFEITVVQCQSPFLKPQLCCIAQNSGQDFL